MYLGNSEFVTRDSKTVGPVTESGQSLSFIFLASVVFAWKFFEVWSLKCNTISCLLKSSFKFFLLQKYPMFFSVNVLKITVGVQYQLQKLLTMNGSYTKMTVSLNKHSAEERPILPGVHS